ncbi:MAG: endonuclease/exonuclease/phosphatase family protein, partial [Cytophagales bacterium]|nr:endonuclease/exonuclease/phosphatase family protein [Armatimonadota bacterium]
MRLRIASYNIHGGTDSEKRPSLPEIERTLLEVDAQVVLLQEVDRRLPRSGFQDQLRVLGRHSKYPYGAFYGRLNAGPFGFGNAILSRLAVHGWRRLPLPSTGGEPRAAIAATLADGAVVWCTHLGLRDEWRATQTEALAAAIGPPPMEAGLPVLLAGDFNAPVEAGEIQQLLARTGLHVQGEDDGPTFPSATPLVRIDHLLARG